MHEQLSLDFSSSSTMRMRKARKALEKIEAEQPKLFSAPPNLDVHLHSPLEAVAQIAGPEPDRAIVWLNALVGSVRIIKSRRVAFPTENLDRLLCVRPPAQVTLDAASLAVARSLWAHKLGFKPLTVTRHSQRLLASSTRWPASLRVKDAPWPSIATLNKLKVPLLIDPKARQLMTTRLASTGEHIATAGLAGSAVLLDASSPALLENLKLPGLSYAGEPQSGFYKMPLLLADRLLEEKAIRLSPDLEASIKKATKRVRPLVTEPSFPWNLYSFQARDAARALRILETTGGVLLAGEMGSGKTTVSLALAEAMQTWPLLVVAPLSAFSTWERQLGEMNKKIYLATAAPSKCWEAIEEGGWDTVVISYDRLHAFSEVVEHYGFQAVIADEIQRIRTPGSRRSRALRQLALSIPVRIGLSGTPLTNRLDDLLPVGAFLAPSEWRPRASNRDLDDMYPGDPVESIADHLGALMVRRRMDETGATLPKRIDHRVMIQLTPEQRSALASLEAEAEAAKQQGEFDDPGSKMHAFVRLQRMRQIINAPSAAGVHGPNPKISAAIDLAEDFLAQGRKGVIFCADRATFRDLGKALDEAEIGWVGIWGSTPPRDRIENERMFHENAIAPNGYPTSVVLCTIQAGAESWSASPTATWLISTAYVYAPSTLSQMEARVYRMNSDINGPDIDICYIHAKAPGGSLDDRMVEILEVKKHLFAQVVDRRAHVDTTKVHYSMEDLVFLLTGKHDDRLSKLEADAQAAVDREQAMKRHAKLTAHRHKGANKRSSDYLDDGSTAKTLEEMLSEADLDDLEKDQPETDIPDCFDNDPDDE